MYYPGHDEMRECIRESKILELGPKQDRFRCKDDSRRQAFIAKYEAEEATRAMSKTSSGGGRDSGAATKESM